MRWQAHTRRKTKRNTFKDDINTKLKLACNSVHRIQIWKIAKNADFGVLDWHLLITRLSWNYTHFFLWHPRVCVQNLKSVCWIVCCPWTLKNWIIQKSVTYVYICMYNKTVFLISLEVYNIERSYIYRQKAFFMARALQPKFTW